MGNNLVSCSECRARNRLQPAGTQPERTRQVPRCGRCAAALPWLVDATDRSFAGESDAPVPVLIDLWAPWCGPCRQLAPALEELSRELAGHLKVLKVNVDENPSLAARFQARSIPLLVLMRNGEVLETVAGLRPKADLRRLIDGYLN